MVGDGVPAVGDFAPDVQFAGFDGEGFGGDEHVECEGSACQFALVSAVAAPV